MTPHHILLGYFLRNWREAVNIVKRARRLQQGGYWACIGKPTQSMKPEQKWQLLCSLTWSIATPCLRSVFASCWDCGRSLCVVQHWLMEKDKKLQLSRRKGGKAHLAHHQVYFIQLLWERRSWVGAHNTDYESGRKGVTKVHVCVHFKSCTCAHVHPCDERDQLSSRLTF